MKLRHGSVLVAILMWLGANTAVARPELFQDPEVLDKQFAPSMSELVIPSNGDLMTGLYYSAVGKGPHPTIILLHAFPGFEKNLDMAQALRRLGYNILFFHYRGTWGSGGSFSWSNSLEDVYAAIAYLKQAENVKNLRVDTKQIILVGHSWGGMLSIKAGAVRDDISCIASIAPEDWTQWLDTEEDQRSIVKYLDGIHSVEGYPSSQALHDLINEREDWTLSNFIQTVGDKKLLLVSGEWDEGFDTSARDRVTALAKAAGTKNISSFTLLKADHSFSAKRIELIKRTSDWLETVCRRK